MDNGLKSLELLLNELPFSRYNLTPQANRNRQFNDPLGQAILRVFEVAKASNLLN